MPLFNYPKGYTGDGELIDDAGILQDMEKCSQAMHITKEALERANADLKEIARSANAFLKAIWSIVPRNFSSQYRNPCWHSDLSLSSDDRAMLLFNLNSENRNYLTKEQVSRLNRNIFKTKSSEGTTFCLPYFFIAGFPKCGTSSLDAALIKHPQIAAPRSKEPHWWTRIPLDTSNFDYLKLSVLRYLIHFLFKVSEGQPKIAYDGSQSTLWDSNFFVHHQDYCAMPAVLSRVLPKAKFIVIMRNPITRLYSQYMYSCTLTYGKATLGWPEQMQKDAATNFHTKVLVDIKYFNRCLQNRSLYECANENRFRGYRCGGVGFRITVSLYYVHLSKWMQFYPREQFLFLRMEDMNANPHSLMTKITEFLGVAPVSPIQAKQWLSRRVNVQKATSKGFTGFQMRYETRKLLEEFYRPYNAMLAELTGDSRFKWED